MKVRLHIERVVLDGLPMASRDRGQFERGLREALGTAFLGPDNSLPLGNVRERRVVAAPVHIGGPAHPVALGEGLGRSVHAAIDGAARR